MQKAGGFFNQPEVGDGLGGRLFGRWGFSIPPLCGGICREDFFSWHDCKEDRWKVKYHEFWDSRGGFWGAKRDAILAYPAPHHFVPHKTSWCLWSYTELYLNTWGCHFIRFQSLLPIWWHAFCVTSCGRHHPVLCLDCSDHLQRSWSRDQGEGGNPCFCWCVFVFVGLWNDWQLVKNDLYSIHNSI